MLWRLCNIWYWDQYFQGGPIFSEKNGPCYGGFVIFGIGTNIFKGDQFFQKKMVRGTNIFSENFGPRTIISGTNFPVTVPLYCVSEMGSSVLSVLRSREVSVSGGFFVQLLMEIFRDPRKRPFYRKCLQLGGVR